MPYVGRTPTPSPVTADDIPANSITADKIQDGVITAADLGANSVGTSELTDNAVTEAKIADAAVTNLKSGRKNLIINGDFQVWQRGTSSTVDNNYGTADRWFKFAAGDTAAWGKGNDSTLGNYCTVTAKAAGSNVGYCNLRQVVEGFHISGSTNFTLSFYMKGSVGGFPIRLEVYNATDGNEIMNNLNIATGNSTWTKYTITFQLDGSDSNDNFNIMLGSNSASAGETLYLAQVQLELGDTATDFEHRSYGEELALCQRYYEICSGGSYGKFPGTSDYRVSVPYKITKRSTPSISVLATSENCCSSVTALGGHEDATASGRVQGTNVFLTGVNKYFYAKFSADSEL